MKPVLIAAGITACFSASSFAAWTVPDLQVGQAGLEQQVQQTPIAEGIDLYKITRGHGDKINYLLSTGPLDKNTIAKYTKELRENLVEYTVEDAPALTPNGKKIGQIVRIRDLDSQSDAKELASILKEKGLKFSVRVAAQDGYPTDGAFQIGLLRVDTNKFDGKVQSVLAHGIIPEAATVTEMSKRTNALAAVNGGFFAFNDKVGDYGAPSGIYVKDGKLIREASDGRPVLVIDNSGDKSKLSFGQSVTSKVFVEVGGKKIRIDGVNRKPGVLLNCGGYDDQPVDKVLHDFVCTDDDEIISYDSFYGKKTPEGKGTEIALDDKGVVKTIKHVRGSDIDNDMTYIQLTGNSKLDVKVGDTVKLSSSVWVDGKEVKLHDGLGMVSAGPTLIHDYKVTNAYYNQQGFNPYPEVNLSKGSQDDDGIGGTNKVDDREAFYNGWVLRRNPRTALGMTDDGIVYAAVVFGRQALISEGASVNEMGSLMHALKVKEAINLDGGGSSMMIVNGEQVGKSSDPVERKVSDSVAFIAN